jgi:hypothetical protein
MQENAYTFFGGGGISLKKTILEKYREKIVESKRVLLVQIVRIGGG